MNNTCTTHATKHAQNMQKHAKKMHNSKTKHIKKPAQKTPIL